MRLTSRLLIIVAITMAGTCISGAQATAPVAISISARQTIKAGSPVVVSITVKNISSVMIGIPGEITSDHGDVWTPFLRGEYSFDFDVEDSGDQPAVETELMKAIRGGTITSRPGSVALSPGDVVKGDADLNELFELTPGTYTIRLGRTFFQLPRQSDLGGNGGQPLRYPRAYGGVYTDPAQFPPVIHSLVKSNTITITVMP